MRYVMTCLLLMIFSFSLVLPEASAARFGGGRSFGVQRSHSSLFSHRNTQTTKSFTQRANTGRWASALGGLMLGGLLATLFMGHGFGAGIFSWLLIGAFIYFVVGLFKKHFQPAFQGNQSQSFQQNNFNSAYTSPLYSSTGNSYPSGFVPETFLRNAKVTFIRLQAAYDQKNIQDLSEFTAPDVFAEIKMQLDERGNALNKTDVVNLDAELLDVSKQAIGTIASVRFSGYIKENDDPMIQLNEIWHFRLLPNNPTWIVAGIQQNAG